MNHKDLKEHKGPFFVIGVSLVVPEFSEIPL